MKGKLTGDYYFAQLTDNEVDLGKLDNVNEDDLIKFEKGEDVEILKEINTSEFLSKTAYVVYSPKSHESMTVDSILVDLIKDWF